MNEKDRIYRKVKSILREDGRRSSYIGEDDFVCLVKEGITINFHIKNAQLDIPNIFRVVKRTQKIVEDRLDYRLEELSIDIYNSLGEMRQEARSKSRYASWIAGIYDGKVKIVSEKEGKEPEALYIILTHELIHLAISNISSGCCPYWLDEGLVVYLSQELSDEYLDKLWKGLKENKILPLDVLENPLPPNTTGSIRQLAYSEVSSITECLIESYGWEKINSVLKQCKRRPIRTILMDFGLNYYLLEQRWKRWFQEKNA